MERWAAYNPDDRNIARLSGKCFAAHNIRQFVIAASSGWIPTKQKSMNQIVDFMYRKE